MAPEFQWLAVVASFPVHEKKMCNLSSRNKNSNTILKPSSNLTSLQNEVFY